MQKVKSEDRTNLMIFWLGAANGPSLREQMDPLLRSGLVMEEMMLSRFPGLPVSWADVVRNHSIIDDAKCYLMSTLVASKKLPMPHNPDFPEVFAKIVHTLCDVIKDGAILWQFPQIH